MPYRIAADAVVAVHLLFIVFVVLGGLLVLRWPRAAWVHLPCAIWGFLIEVFGWICPLTPLENWLRARAGGGGYSGGFTESYVLPLVYPGELTRGIQLALAAGVVVINVTIYSIASRKAGRRRRK
jgi:hypothetical protein